MKQRMAQYHVKNLEKLGYLTRVKSKAKRLKTDGFKLLLDNPKECSATGCVIGVHPIAPTISISKDIDIKKRKIETTATAPEWLSLVDNDGTLVNNVSHPKIQEYVSDIESDYVGVDLVAEAKKYKLWWEGKKAKKPKLAFRNWLEKAKENYGESKRRVSKGIATEVSTTIDERTRELSERQRKSKSR